MRLFTGGRMLSGLVIIVLGIVLAARTSARQPTPRAYEWMEVAEFDPETGRAEIRIRANEALTAHACSTAQVRLESTGDIAPNSSGPVTMTINKDVEFDTTVTVRILGEKPGRLGFTFEEGCFEKEWTWYGLFQKRGDSLVQLRNLPPEPWVQPEGTMRAYRPEDLPRDTTIGRFLFDLRDTAHFRQFKENEDWINPDRRMTEPGFYEIELQRYRYERAINDGFRGWPADSVPE